MLTKAGQEKDFYLNIICLSVCAVWLRLVLMMMELTTRGDLQRNPKYDFWLISSLLCTTLQYLQTHTMSED